jgi:arylsulfatase A-like enzyme/Tfp pilus assembly protein PilF
VSTLRAPRHPAISRRWLAPWLVFLLSATALAANSPATSHKPANVILITMDTLRADRLGCYGAKQVQTPVLDSLCHDGIVYEHAFSQVPLTWPSHAAILTGTYPFQNGVQDFTGQPLSPKFRTIAEAFKQNGYTTGAVVSSFVLDRSWGLARGFDFYDDAFGKDLQTKDLGLVDRRADESVSHAIAWLEKTASAKTSSAKSAPLKTSAKPFFLWLHLYDPHSPYDPPEPFRTQYKDHPYDGEIAYADHELGHLVAWLKAHRLYDQSVIVFLSDHGESLGEHGEAEHGFFVYNSTIQIPLIVKPPAGSGFQPTRASSPAESVAIAPTLLQLAAVKDLIQKQFQAAALVGSDSSNNGGASAYSETFYPFASFGWSPLHSIESDRYHYIDAPNPELYDVIADPQEKINVAAQQPGVVAVLKDKLQERLKNNPFPVDSSRASNLTPDAAARLRALGYVAYRAQVSPEALKAGLPDPKVKLDEFNMILQASDAFRAQDFTTGEAILKKVGDEDPKMYVVPFMLGEAALRQQKWVDAEAWMKKCLELNPDFAEAMTGLANALHQQKDDAGAKQWLSKAVEQNPQNYRAWYELGNVERGTDKAAAQQSYEKAIAIQPNFAQAHRELGILAMQKQDYGTAAQHLVRATESGLVSAQTYNFLGIAYSRTNRLTQAIAAYRQALKSDPQMAEAHLNLGYALQRHGDMSSAKSEYEAACKLDAKYCGTKSSTKQ